MEFFNKMALMNSTLNEIKRRLDAKESPEDIAKHMHMNVEVIYKVFKIPKIQQYREAVGFEPFVEQAVPITSRPGWKVLRS